MSSIPSQPTVAVAGGGLAGLAAACALSDIGFRVTLFEKRPFLGPLLPMWRSDGLIPEGESRQSGAVVILNRGLGMTGGPLPRARFFSRPEIRLIEVVSR